MRRHAAAKRAFGPVLCYHLCMGRPYGKTRRTGRKSGNTPKSASASFKMPLRGKDGAPLSMKDVQQGLYEAARYLQQFEGTLRAKRATLYLTMVDEDGK